LYGEQNGGQNEHIDIGDRLGEDVVKGKCVGRALGKEIVLCRELGRDLIGGMAAYRWVRNCLCVCLVTGNRNSRIYSIRNV